MENFYCWFYLKKAERICFKTEKFLKISEKNISTFSILKKQKKKKNFSYINLIFFQLKFLKNIKEFTEFFIFRFFNLQISQFFFRENENFFVFRFLKKQKQKKILFFYFSHNFFLKKQKNFVKRNKLNYLSFSIIVEVQQWFCFFFQNFQKNLSFENFFFSFFEFFKSNSLITEKPYFPIDQNRLTETQNEKMFKKTNLESSDKNFFFCAPLYSCAPQRSHRLPALPALPAKQSWQPSPLCFAGEAYAGEGREGGRGEESSAKKQHFQNFVFGQNTKKLCSILKLNKFPLKNQKIWSFKFLKYSIDFVNFCLPETKFVIDTFNLQKKSMKNEKRKTNSQKNQKLQFKNQNFHRQFKDSPIYTQNKTTRQRVFSKKNKKLQFKFFDFSTQKVKSHLMLKRNFFQHFFHFFSILFSSFFEKTRTLFSSSQRPANPFSFWTRGRSSGTSCSFSTNDLNDFFANSKKLPLWQKKWKENKNWKNKNLNLEAIFLEKIHTFSIDLKRDMKYNRYFKKKFLFQKIFHNLKTFPNFFFQGEFKKQHNYVEQRVNQISSFFPYTKLESDFFIDEQLNQKKDLNFLKLEEKFFLKFSRNFPIQNKNIFFCSFFKKNFAFLSKYQKKNLELFCFFSQIVKIQFEKSFFHLFQFLEFFKIKNQFFQKFVFFSFKTFFSKKLFSFKFSWRKMKFLEKQKNNFCLNFFNFFDLSSLSNRLSFFFLNFSFFEKNLQLFFETFGYFHFLFFKNFFLKDCTEKDIFKNDKFFKNSIFQHEFKYFLFSFLKKKISFFLFQKEKKNIWLFSKKSFSLQIKIQKKKFSKIVSFEAFFIFLSKYLTTEKFLSFRKRNTNLFFQKQRFFGCHFDEKNFFLNMFSNFFCFQEKFIYKTNEKKEWYLFFVLNSQIFSKFNFHFLKPTHRSRPFLSFSVLKTTNIIFFDWFFHQVSNFDTFKIWLKNNTTQKNRILICSKFDKKIRGRFLFPLPSRTAASSASHRECSASSASLAELAEHPSVPCLCDGAQSSGEGKEMQSSCFASALNLFSAGEGSEAALLRISKQRGRDAKQHSQQFLLNKEKIFSFQKIPTQKNINFHLKECKWLIQNSKNQTQLNLMKKLHKKIQLWCKNYTASSAKQIFFYCDSMVLKFLWNWARKIHSKKSKFWIRKKYFHFLPIPYSLNLNRTKPIKTWFFGKKIGTQFICLPLHSQRKVESL